MRRLGLDIENLTGIEGYFESKVRKIDAGCDLSHQNVNSIVPYERC